MPVYSNSSGQSPGSRSEPSATLPTWKKELIKKRQDMHRTLPLSILAASPERWKDHQAETDKKKMASSRGQTSMLTNRSVPPESARARKGPVENGSRRPVKQVNGAAPQQQSTHQGIAGIVDKMRSKFNVLNSGTSATATQPSLSPVRRTSSLEHLLDTSAEELEAPPSRLTHQRKVSLSRRPNDVAVASPRSGLRPGARGTSGAFTPFNNNVIIIEQSRTVVVPATVVENRRRATSTQRSPYRPSSVTNLADLDTSLKTDIVSTYKKIFEADKQTDPKTIILRDRLAASNRKPQVSKVVVVANAKVKQPAPRSPNVENGSPAVGGPARSQFSGQPPLSRATRSGQSKVMVATSKPIVQFTSLRNSEYTPQPAVQVSARPAVKTSPRPTTPVSPQPTVPTSPQSAVPVSPKPVVKVSSRPTVQVSPRSAVPFAPQSSAVSAAPRPSVTISAWPGVQPPGSSSARVITKSPPKSTNSRSDERLSNVNVVVSASSGTDAESSKKTTATAKKYTTVQLPVTANPSLGESDDSEGNKNTQAEFESRPSFVAIGDDQQQDIDRSEAISKPVVVEANEKLPSTSVEDALPPPPLPVTPSPAKLKVPAKVNVTPGDDVVGGNVIVGRSALSKTRKRKLKIAFDDQALSTYEYPSENSLLDNESQGVGSLGTDRDESANALSNKSQDTLKSTPGIGSSSLELEAEC